MGLSSALNRLKKRDTLAKEKPEQTPAKKRGLFGSRKVTEAPAEVKPEVKPAAKPKTEKKPAAKAEVKVEKPATKKPAAKAAPKPVAKAAAVKKATPAKPETKKVETKAPAKKAATIAVEPKEEAKPAKPAKAAAKPAAKSTAKPKAKAAKASDLDEDVIDDIDEEGDLSVSDIVAEATEIVDLAAEEEVTEDDSHDDPTAKETEKAVEASGGFVLSHADEDDIPVQTTTISGATADPVKDYLKQIGKVALLNAEQEVELGLITAAFSWKAHSSTQEIISGNKVIRLSTVTGLPTS